MVFSTIRRHKVSTATSRLIITSRRKRDYRQALAKTAKGLKLVSFRQREFVFHRITSSTPIRLYFTILYLN